MIIVQNINKDIIAIGTTIPKAMREVSMPSEKYEDLRKKIQRFQKKPVFYNEYYFSKW